MDNIFYRVLLNDRVKVEPRHLSKDYRSYVQNKLKVGMEGKCTKHGYIKEGSIELYKIAPGNIELIGLNGDIIFDVYYYADVCNPLIGNVVKAVVSNVNKFGVLADVNGILEIIIAKNSINIIHDTVVELDNIKIGDEIFVEVIGKKFELFDKKISIVGKVVSSFTQSNTKTSKKVIKEDKEKDDDEDGIEDMVAGGDGDDDEELEEEDDGTDAIDNDDDDDIDEFVKGGNEFFDSDEEDLVDEEYEFYSENEFEESDMEDEYD